MIRQARTALWAGSQSPEEGGAPIRVDCRQFVDKRHFALRAHCASNGVEAGSFAGPDVADAVPVHCVHGVVVLQALDSGPRAERAARRRDPPITTAP